jgi:dihydroflavonol-4-reductase
VDVVYHLAAHISLETADRAQIEAVNVVGTRNVVSACLACGVRSLVHLSSIHAFAHDHLDKPLDENSPRTLSAGNLPYDRSKAAGEIEVRRGMAAGLNAVILNPTAIIGPYDFKPSYFGRALLAMANQEIPALVRGGYDWVDVRDVVAAMIRVEEHALPGSGYILSGHWRSVRAVADQVAALTGVPAPRLVLPLWVAYLGLPMIRLYAKLNRQAPLYTRVSLAALRNSPQVDSTLARRDLNYKPRPFKKTIAAAVEWFVENGYLPRKPQ